MAEKLGDRIKRIRMARELGLRETAAKIGRSAALLSRIESNDESVKPSEEVIKALAEVLHDDFDTLMTLAGRVSGDVEAVITSDPGMPAFLRRASEAKLSAGDLMRLLDKSKTGK